MIGRAPYQRRVPPPKSDVIDRHAQAVGQVSIAWNDLHSSLFEIFWFCIGTDKHEIAHAIWHTFQSDRSQRSLLVATAQHALSNKSFIAIKWIAKCADKIAEDRNSLIHADINFTLSDDGMVIHPNLVSSRYQHQEYLSKADLTRISQKVSGDLRVLSQYTRDIFWHLADPETFALWPYRPRLAHVQGAIKKRKQNRKISPKSQGIGQHS